MRLNFACSLVFRSASEIVRGVPTGQCLSSAEINLQPVKAQGGGGHLEMLSCVRQSTSMIGFSKCLGLLLAITALKQQRTGKVASERYECGDLHVHDLQPSPFDEKNIFLCGVC